MTHLYIYNCNNLNEFLEEIDTETPEEWAGCSTEVPFHGSETTGTSYAFNEKTNAWDTLIDDWRSEWIYLKSDSRVRKLGDLGPLPERYTALTPPDQEIQYVFDEENNTWNEYIEMVNPSDVIKKYEDAIQKHIDSVAQARGYDNGYTCASYFDDKNARYASDAQIFKDWRSDVWVQVNQILNSYASAIGGAEQIPVSALSAYPTPQQIIAQLPTIEWQEL